MEYKELSIIHSPLGNEQPYFQQPFERFPRYPRHNQTVMVGAVIEPVDGGEHVDLLWRRHPAVDSTEETALRYTDFEMIPAVCIGASDSIGNSGCDRYWMAALPGMPGGTQIMYRFRVSSGTQHKETELFHYTVAEETVFDRCESWFADAEGRFVCTLTASAKPDTELHWIWEKSEEKTVTHTVSCLPAPEKASDQSALKILEEYQDSVRLQYCEFEFHISSNPFSLRVEVLGDDANMTLLERVGPVLCSSYQVGNEGRIHRNIAMSFRTDDHEAFFGFGERYNRLNQRGEVVANRVFEQYKNQRLKTYLPIPFFISNRGYGSYVNTDRHIIYDLCAHDPGIWRIDAEIGDSDNLTLQWFFGNPKEILQSFIQRTGAITLPPEWVFGPWMSSNEWNSQERVMKEVAKGDSLDIPASVVVIEAWSDEATFYLWNGAEYLPKPSEQPFRLSDLSFPEEGLWPDPKGMIDTLHKEGKRLILWQIPVIKAFQEGEQVPEQQRRDAAFVEENGLCLREEDGTPYNVRPGWFQNSMVIDLASKKAREWWFAKRAYLMEECGVDGFKTDGGEHIWGYSVRPSEARSRELRESGAAEVQGDSLINTFPAHYLAAYKEAMDSSLGVGNGVTFSRSGYTGVQNTPCHWAGDQDSTWEAYRAVLKAVLNANISGIPFIGWDIGGFSGKIPGPELYLRSAAAAALSPIMQYHSEFLGHRVPHVDRTPWNIADRSGDDHVITVYRLYAKLRMALISYITQEAAWCCSHGEPLMRPLWFDVPEDPVCWKIEDQYRFGRALLVAPVLYEGDVTRKLYLPSGTWEDVWTGEHFPGNRWILRDVPIEIIPVYRDTSAIWPVSPDLFAEYLREWIG